MAIIEAHAVSVSIDDKDILRNCNLKVKTGEFIGIIGPNGSGKTTFLKVLRGLLPSASGIVKLYGADLKTMSEKEISRKVAYMQQNINIRFGYSAKEIVMAARYPYLKWWQNEGSSDEMIIEQAMRYTGVWTLRNKDITTVSGGERQRIFLAKALAQDTDILLLDEPTAALDMGYVDEIFRYCRTLCDSGKTIIIVIHDLEIAAKFCSRMVLFSKGQIINDGSPSEVLTAENLATAFYLSSTVYNDPYFNEHHIFIYPNGETTSKQYLLPGVSLPASATTTIISSDDSIS